MLVIAHRGYHAAAPENTLPAFEAAVAAGVAGIETDVRITRDGLPILIHDRVLGTGQAVADLSRKEIDRVLGYEVPTLDEGLEHFPGILWNIEIKSREGVSSVLRVLRRHQAGRRLIVTSFHHDLVAICASSLEIDCGLLVAHHPHRLYPLLADLDLDGNPRINHIVWDYEILDDTLLKQATAQGFRNFIYGAVTKTEHDNCRALGVEGVITDYPLLMRGA